MKRTCLIAAAAVFIAPIAASASGLEITRRTCTGSEGGITVTFHADEVSSRPGSSHQAILVDEGSNAEITGVDKNAFCNTPGDNGTLKVFWKDGGRAGKQGGGLYGVVGKEPTFICSIAGENIEVDCR